ncbi:MAG: hypothetical protein BJ554DRAFT_4509, partial [Olpidium bornovanus]
AKTTPTIRTTTKNNQVDSGDLLVSSSRGQHRPNVADGDRRHPVRLRDLLCLPALCLHLAPAHDGRPVLAASFADGSVRAWRPPRSGRGLISRGPAAVRDPMRRPSTASRSSPRLGLNSPAGSCGTRFCLWLGRRAKIIAKIITKIIGSGVESTSQFNAAGDGCQLIGDFVEGTSVTVQWTNSDIFENFTKGRPASNGFICTLYKRPLKTSPKVAQRQTASCAPFINDLTSGWVGQSRVLVGVCHVLGDAVRSSPAGSECLRLPSLPESSEHLEPGAGPNPLVMTNDHNRFHDRGAVRLLIGEKEKLVVFQSKMDAARRDDEFAAGDARHLHAACQAQVFGVIADSDIPATGPKALLNREKNSFLMIVGFPHWRRQIGKCPGKFGQLVNQARVVHLHMGEELHAQARAALHSSPAWPTPQAPCEGHRPQPLSPHRRSNTGGCSARVKVLQAFQRDALSRRRGAGKLDMNFLRHQERRAALCEMAKHTGAPRRRITGAFWPPGFARAPQAPHTLGKCSTRWPSRVPKLAQTGRSGSHPTGASPQACNPSRFHAKANRAQESLATTGHAAFSKKLTEHTPGLAPRAVASRRRPATEHHTTGLALRAVANHLKASTRA